jgi:cytochrome c oxidase subunit 2
VIAIGRQYWWEYRFPDLNVVTANELHVPVSDPAHPSPTFITLLSADTDHSFWIPRLAGKTDLIPNRVNKMWIEPTEPGLYLGQCASCTSEISATTTGPINCHTVAGTAANGRFGPDLTHLMSRETLAAGAVPNTWENLRRWIQNPDASNLDR